MWTYVTAGGSLEVRDVELVLVSDRA
jgi:hypothetical protein